MIRSVVIGTAGHIDHGKSALVYALTGTDPDRLKEEKARGITIDLGFAHARLGGFDLAFVDVPGHERFVKNMLAGVGGIDGVLLVIAADESVMPQTREHFAICRLLQVPGGVIALTKTDLVDADTLELATLDARELVAGSMLADAPIVPVSSKTGLGLDALRDALQRLAAAVPARRSEGAPRLPIDRVFSMRGFGTVVTGTLTAGELRENQELVALPGGRPVKVRGLQVHGASQRSAGAGRRVAVNVGGADVADLSRGQTLSEPGALDVTRRFDATVDLLADARPLKHGARVRFHHGTSEVLGRIALAARTHGAAAVMTELTPGASAAARIRLEAPAVLTRGDRFIIRAYSPAVTIGGGRVLDPAPTRTAIRTPAGARRFRRLDASDDEAVLAMIEERGVQGFAMAALTSRAGLTPAAATTFVDRMVAAGAIVAAGDLLFAAPVVSGLGDRLTAALTAHHRASPLSQGLPREEAREKVFGRLAAPALFDHVVAALEASRTIGGRDRLALAGHTVSLSPDEARAEAALERVYRDAGLAPPDLPAAASAAEVAAPVAERVSKLLLRNRRLIKVDALLFHADALARLKDEIAALKTAGPAARLDVAAFKDRYGVSRKYAIPLLEWLDRERVTRRVGESRVIL